MPNSKQLYADFRKKQQMSAPVNMRDIVVRMDNEEDALFDFMLRNDPEQVNKLLHESDAPFFIGQNANFVPNPKAMAGELKQLFIKREYGTLNKIIGGFRIWMKSGDKFTTNPTLIQEMEKLSMIEMDNKGEYRFRIGAPLAEA